jgi:hypothetical protein
MARKLGSKDKVKRKSRGLLTNTALLGGATAIGGYVGGKDSKVNARQGNAYKNVIARINTEMPGIKDKYPEKYEKAIKMLKSKEFRQAVRQDVKDIETTANKYKFLDNKLKRKFKEVRYNNKLNKIRNVSIGKGALIGLGVGSALLGANELRKRMSKKK